MCSTHDTTTSKYSRVRKARGLCDLVDLDRFCEITEGQIKIIISRCILGLTQTSKIESYTTVVGS